jgi:Tol biopolymer transport system component
MRVLAYLPLLLLVPGASAQVLTRLSMPEDPLILGTQADDYSLQCRFAGSRYVVFGSRATNLVLDDRNASEDVFLHDRNTATTQRVSVDSAGSERIGLSVLGDASDDGRYVVFQSSAAFVAGGPANVQQIWLRDRSSGTTTLVSGASGSFGNSSSLAPRINGTGTHVVFQSAASNLVGGDGNAVTDIFVYTIASAALVRVSTDATGAQSNGLSANADIADSGSLVVFESEASNLVAGDGNGRRDVFAKDLVTGAVTRLSLDVAGGDADGTSTAPAIAADASAVAFVSGATDLVAGDTNAQNDIFVYRLGQSPAIVRVNVPNAGGEADRPSSAPSISSDGRFVAFMSAATNLVAGQIVLQNFASQPFRADLAGAPLRAVLSVAGTSGDRAALSDDGARICVESSSTLLPDDYNGTVRDIYLRDFTGGAWERASRASAPIAVRSANGASTAVEISADGRYVAFNSQAGNLDRDAIGRSTSADAYWLDRVTGAIERHPLGLGGAIPNFGSATTAVSADGRYLVIESAATNLVPSDSSNLLDVLRLDRSTGALVHVSLPIAAGSGASDQSHASDDGARIVFRSAHPGLVAGDSNGVADIFLWQELQPLRRISVDSTGTQANGASRLPRISGDGNTVVFLSSASNLVPGDSAGFEDVFVHELATGLVSRVSVGLGGAEANGASHGADLSANGALILYTTDADNTHTNDRPGPDVVRFDRGSAVAISASKDLPSEETVAAEPPRISDSALFALFESVKGSGSTAERNVWRRDLVHGIDLLLSSDRGTNRNRRNITGIAVDASGQLAIFSGDDDALLPGDDNGRSDVYLADTRSGGGSIGFSAATIEFVEGSDTEVVVTFVRRDGSAGAASASYTTTDSSATSPADYTARSGSVSWADGESGLKGIVIAIIDDTEVEPDQSFTLTLSNPSGAALGNPSTLTITIRDDDVAPPADLVLDDSFED